MKTKSIIALSVVLALAGCGGSDGGSSSSSGNGGNGGNGGDVTNPPSTSLIQHWSMAKVGSEIANTSTATGAAMTICNSSQTPIETEHFLVGFSQNAKRLDRSELIEAAKMTQVGFDELISHSKLSPSGDLNITSDNKWVACYDDSNIRTGNDTGTGYANLFEFSPTALNISDSDFSGSYILAKHELFHVVQYELLNDSVQFSEIPYWFMEGSAEYFAGRPLKNTTHKLHNFVEDTFQTPMSMEMWSDENDLMQDSDIHNEYRNHMYDLYHKNVLFYINKGMSLEQAFTLMKDSAGYNFVNAMGDLEQGLKIETSYTELKDNVESYKNTVIAELNSTEVSGKYVDDVNLDVQEILLMKKGTEEIVAEGSVSRDQASYAFLSPVADGTYDGYVMALVSDDEDYMYGSIPVTVKGGKMGNLNFTGAQDLND